MNATELLLNRQSDPSLTIPAPNNDELHTILTAGMRIPDHGALKPFNISVYSGEGLNKLSSAFVKAMTLKKAEQAKIDKAAKMPFRAPMVIVVSTDYQNHEKVPEKEQLITAGCVVHAMQMAAFSLGYGAMWRTGELAFNEDVKTSLDIASHNDITGFLYIGTKAKDMPIKPERYFADRVKMINR
ncbi:nitroreductase family protein [Thalassotalea sp. 1_MG-2023]|uniref:nitroreductase family protein n=1 Tax=Thalassotalea sp. 1_MG-2023 TaxID=3062680 RepID=UPI0026E1B760|nr:nitroreductase family protein [Thalassotalea sp. 1_MG-2023]MDO6428737.1 nitroreductase family protein [Thalassotalea sp. 1_MG-2023]